MNLHLVSIDGGLLFESKNGHLGPKEMVVRETLLWEYILMLLIIRTIMVIILFFGGALVGCVLALLRPFDPRNGVTYARLVFPACLKILGIKLEVRRQHLMSETTSCIYIANHQSWLDVLTFGSLLRLPTISIGKKEVKWIPIFGWLYFLSGHILIDRHHHEKAMNSMEQARQVLSEKGYGIWMFPEGTRKGPKPLSPFKKGAFHLAIDLGYVLQPLVCTSIPRFVTLRKWNAGTILIEALSPIETTGYNHDNVDELIARTHEIMKEAVTRVNAELENREQLRNTAPA